MTTKRNHNRRLENAKISISLPKSLLEEIDALALDDNRSRSNLIAHLLRSEIALSEPYIPKKSIK